MSRVFVARLVGTPVFDPAGDPVGKVRDVVAVLRPQVPDARPPRAIGLVVEIAGRRRVFVAMTRVVAIDPGQVITTGLLNMRRFQQRPAETLVIAQMLDRTVTLNENEQTGTVFDVGMEQTRTRDWELSKLAVVTGRRRFRSRGHTTIVNWNEVSGLASSLPGQPATQLVATLESLRPTDIAGVLHDLPASRRLEVAQELDDKRLAEVLEEMPSGEQVELLGMLETERAADVVDEMDPDDAADLVQLLTPELAEAVLSRMEPKDADDVRRLMTYDDLSAGGLMTSEPIVLAFDATIAEALAQARQAEITPALAAMLYVCRPPLETPTGKYLGTVHLQRLLREPPSTLVSAVFDGELDPLAPEASLQEVATHLAAYDLVAAPVVDDAGRLIGAVTVDDVLAHMLPANWREELHGD